MIVLHLYPSVSECFIDVDYWGEPERAPHKRVAMNCANAINRPTLKFHLGHQEQGQFLTLNFACANSVLLFTALPRLVQLINYGIHHNYCVVIIEFALNVIYK